jgi:hypothetical protein
VSSPLPARPGYLGIITNWDGQWYESLATHGYPLLSRGVAASPDALQAWAFPPVFPLLTRAVMWTGLSFPWAASVVNGVCGALAMVLLFRLLQRRAGRFVAASGVTLVCCFITAPLLQAAYSESLALLLLIAAFLTVTERKYRLASVAVVLLGFTRIVTPPFALVVTIHAVARYRKRDTDPLSRREVAGLAVLELVSAGGAVTWSLATRLLTSASTAAGGRSRGVVDGHNWFAQSYALAGWVGPAVVCAIVLLLIVLAARPCARSWGLEVRTWLWSYPLYIFAVTPVTTGVLRYLLLCFPLGLALTATPAAERTRKLRILVVAGVALAGLALHWWWIENSFVIHAGSVMP